MPRMANMHHANLMRVLYNAENDEIVAYRITLTPVSSAGENLVAAEFMGCGKFGKFVVASLDVIDEFCRGLGILKFICKLHFLAREVLT